MVYRAGQCSKSVLLVCWRSGKAAANGSRPRSLRLNVDHQRVPLLNCDRGLSEFFREVPFKLFFGVRNSHERQHTHDLPVQVLVAGVRSQVLKVLHDAYGDPAVLRDERIQLARSGRTSDCTRAPVALHFAYYNFCRVHRAIRVTPAMEPGTEDHVSDLAETAPLRIWAGHRMVPMIWTAWNNGAHHETGAGYGLKVSAEDRDQHFSKSWQSVYIELPTNCGTITAEANIAKKTFWGPDCREMIDGDIGRWLRGQGYAPWPKDTPPNFEVQPIASRRFRVVAFIP